MIEITLAAVCYDSAGFSRTRPPVHDGLRPLQLLVDGKKVFDLLERMRKYLIERVDAVEPRIAIGYGKNFLIVFSRIHHIQDADRTRFHQASREARLINQNDDVQRITVLRKGSR